MRTPLQILFLILVTDLPPSIALGMEPGEKSILKAQPRPKDEPIVLGWMWMSINMNGAILSGVIIGVYIFALQHFCGEIFQEDILEIPDYQAKLEKARTVAFIALVYSENIRAYIARSFDRPFWNNLLSNLEMQKAIVLAQICLYVAVLVPGISDQILKLRGLEIGAWGWGVSFVGPVATVILCELAKLITYVQNTRYQAKLRRQRQAENARMEGGSTIESTPLPALMQARAVKEAEQKLEIKRSDVSETEL